MEEGVGEMPMEMEAEEAKAEGREGKFKGASSEQSSRELQPTEQTQTSARVVGEARSKAAQKPDFRVVQPQVDKEGKQQLVDVGALWKNVSRSGNEFYTLKIGKMKLLVFENRFKE